MVVDYGGIEMLVLEHSKELAEIAYFYMDFLSLSKTRNGDNDKTGFIYHTDGVATTPYCIERPFAVINGRAAMLRLTPSDMSKNWPIFFVSRLDGNCQLTAHEKHGAEGFNETTYNFQDLESLMEKIHDLLVPYRIRDYGATA